MSDNPFVRVKDAVTGHEYSVRESALDAERHERIDKEAVDASGDPLPDKPNKSKGGTRSTRSTSAAPSQTASEPASEPTTKE